MYVRGWLVYGPGRLGLKPGVNRASEVKISGRAAQGLNRAVSVFGMPWDFRDTLQTVRKKERRPTLGRLSEESLAGVAGRGEAGN